MLDFIFINMKLFYKDFINCLVFGFLDYIIVEFYFLECCEYFNGNWRVMLRDFREIKKIVVS